MADIRHEVLYPQSPRTVWHSLTTRTLLSEWLMPTADFEPVVGCVFQFRAPRMPGWDGIITCEVVELDPPSRVVWSWQGSNMRSATRVTFTIEPRGAGTRLVLEHSGFRGLGGWILSRMHRAGWRGKFLARRLRAVLNNLPTEPA